MRGKQEEEWKQILEAAEPEKNGPEELFVEKNAVTQNEISKESESALPMERTAADALIIEETPKEMLTVEVPGSEGEGEMPVIVASSEPTGKTEETLDDLERRENFTQEEIEKRSKREFRSRLSLVLILGFLIGIAVKIEALKRITIGYEDYLMRIRPQAYDISSLQLKLQQEREIAAQAETQSGTDDSSGSVDSADGSGGTAVDSAGNATQNDQAGTADQSGN